jgi:long-chain acyl-CoA synthetase
MEDASAVKRWLFQVLHRRRAPLRLGDPGRTPGPGSADRLLTRLGNALIYGPLRNVLGMSNIRIAYTAGAAIGPDLFRLLSLDRHQSEAALRADGTCAYVCLQPTAA